jgi:EAL domain-containing protein (putative c-di-GMP-specific phosphodiesterase class I)
MHRDTPVQYLVAMEILHCSEQHAHEILHLLLEVELSLGQLFLQISPSHSLHHDEDVVPFFKAIDVSGDEDMLQ